MSPVTVARLGETVRTVTLRFAAVLSKVTLSWFAKNCGSVPSHTVLFLRPWSHVASVLLPFHVRFMEAKDAQTVLSAVAVTVPW